MCRDRRVRCCASLLKRLGNSPILSPAILGPTHEVPHENEASTQHLLDLTRVRTRSTPIVWAAIRLPRAAARLPGSRQNLVHYARRRRGRFSRRQGSGPTRLTAPGENHSFAAARARTFS